MTIFLAILGVYVVGAVWTGIHYRSHALKFALKAALLWPEAIWLILRAMYQVKYLFGKRKR